MDPAGANSSSILLLPLGLELEDLPLGLAELQVQFLALLQALLDLSPEIAALNAPLKMVKDFKKIQQQGKGTGAKAGEYESDGLFHVQ